MKAGWLWTAALVLVTFVAVSAQAEIWCISVSLSPNQDYYEGGTRVTITWKYDPSIEPQCPETPPFETVDIELDGVGSNPCTSMTIARDVRFSLGSYDWTIDCGCQDLQMHSAMIHIVNYEAHIGGFSDVFNTSCD